MGILIVEFESGYETNSMNKSIQIISLGNLALAFIPLVVILIVLWRWKADPKTTLYAFFRMVIQLFLIGYVLNFIFLSDRASIVIGVLIIMLFSASWISLRTIKGPGRELYLISFLSILVGGGSVLLLITQVVIRLDPWFLPSYMIPLAGMIFASSMNSISLSSERLKAELERKIPFRDARLIALKAGLIPITNSLFAVGLVSLPGMMTGQILSGVSPFIAARYQIMVMCMMFGSAGISTVLFLTWLHSRGLVDRMVGLQKAG